MKKNIKITVLILAAIIAGLLITGYAIISPIAAVGTGYYAKMLCSSAYVSGRAYADIMAEDLEMADDANIAVRLDEKHKTAEASFLGLFSTRAVFRPGLGCTLCVEDVEEIELRQQALGVSGLTVKMSPAIWPEGDMVSDKSSLKVDMGKMEKALDRAFEETPEGPRRTRAVVVVYNGRIVAERYAPGISKDTPLIGWSMTKSVTNALVGILVKQNKLSLTDDALMPQWKMEDDPRKAITLDQLMRMSSGLSFIEEYEENITSDVNTMLFTRKSTADYAANKPLEADPGSKWYYSSGTTNIIARIARDASGLSQTEWFRFPRMELFDKIGMKSAIIEPDPSGNFVGSSYMYATARDWARFGLLYLNDGVWMEERILPEGWVKYSTTPTPHVTRGRAYGAQFWLNTGNPDPWLPFMPEDTFMALGHEGQAVLVTPSRNTVIVRMGLARGPSFQTFLAFAADVLNALPGK